MRVEMVKINSEKPEPSLIRYAADQIRAGEVLERVRSRPGARLLYLDAPVPPAFGRPERSEERPTCRRRSPT